jgi:hypothetical protein
MITKIIVTNKDKDHYLYDSETKILLAMLNKGLEKYEINKKYFVILKNPGSKATIRIYSVTDKFFFLKKYNLKTTLKIKYN